MSKHLALVIAGGILATGGVALSAGGAATLAVAGSDDTLSSHHHDVSTPTTALLSEPATFSTRGLDFPGDLTAKLSIRDAGEPVFIGVGPAEQVDAYLAGSAVDVVTDVEVWPFDLTTDRRDGETEPGPPSRESFWVAQAEGTTSATLDWKLRDGDYRLVIMNADGSTGVGVSASGAIRISWLTDAGLLALGGGLLTALGGALLLYKGLRDSHRDAAAAAAATAVPEQVHYEATTV